MATRCGFLFDTLEERRLLSLVPGLVDPRVIPAPRGMSGVALAISGSVAAETITLSKLTNQPPEFPGVDKVYWLDRQGSVYDRTGVFALDALGTTPAFFERARAAGNGFYGPPNSDFFVLRVNRLVVVIQSASQGPSNVVLEAAGGNDRVTISREIRGYQQVLLGNGDDRLDFLADSDWAVTGATATLVGGNGRDRIDAGSSDGRIYMMGSAQRDTLIGTDGDDTLSGGGGNDLLYGGRADLARNDYSPGRDQIFGGAGTDWAFVDNRDLITGVERWFSATFG